MTLENIKVKNYSEALGTASVRNATYQYQRAQCIDARMVLILAILRTQGKCYLCGVILYEYINGIYDFTQRGKGDPRSTVYEHIYPASQNNPFVAGNGMVACECCNAEKKDQDPLVYNKSRFDRGLDTFCETFEECAEWLHETTKEYREGQYNFLYDLSVNGTKLSKAELIATALNPTVGELYSENGGRGGVGLEFKLNPTPKYRSQISLDKRCNIILGLDYKDLYETKSFTNEEKTENNIEQDVEKDKKVVSYPIFKDTFVDSEVYTMVGNVTNDIWQTLELSHRSIYDNGFSRLARIALVQSHLFPNKKISELTTEEMNLFIAEALVLGREHSCDHGKFQTWIRGLALAAGRTDRYELQTITKSAVKKGWEEERLILKAEGRTAWWSK